MADNDQQNETYPTIKFFLRNGEALAWIVGLVIALVGVWGTYVSKDWFCVAGGLFGGWLGLMIMRCCREVLALIADTLMPQ